MAYQKNKPNKKKKNKSIKPKKTQNQLLYEREVQKLFKRMAYAEKKKNLKFEATIIPPKPKRITKKDIERIHGLRGETLWQQGKQSIYGDIRDNGYEIDYTPANINMEILEGIEDIINQFDATVYTSEDARTRAIARRDALKSLLEDAISNSSRREVAQRLNQAGTASELFDMFERILYASRAERGEIDSNFNYVARIITGSAFTQQEAQSYDTPYTY